MTTVSLLIRHDLPVELSELLEKVQTDSKKEICGDFIILKVSDPDTVPQDVRRIAQEVEHIKRIQSETSCDFATKDVICGKANLVDGELIYKQRSTKNSPVRKLVERITGSISETIFNSALCTAEFDIRYNNIAKGNFTSFNQVIEKVAHYAKAEISATKQ